MKLRHTSIAVLAALSSRHVAAQSVDLSDTTGVTFVKGSRTAVVGDDTPTGTYATYTSKITLKAFTETETATLSGGTNTLSSTLTGVFTSETMTTASNVTDSTQTSTTAKPTNTQPCNNYVELCTRKYSNVTVVGCHNSPFVRPGNSGSNQELDVTTQLNDGVRFLQAQIQWPSNSSVPHFCHTSCDLLDAGPITEWLTTVRKWVDNHPYDVVTILLGNGNYSKPNYYAPYIEQTGIVKYAYSPPYLPMEYDDWPTLEQLIVRGKRVIMFLDYEANQTAYPWLLDEFSQVWETPFDPVDRTFPCTAQRPPNLSKKSGANRLYLMNHNLNAEFNVFGTELLVPAVSLLNETNNYTGYGSLGLAANNCRSEWGHPPNFLNVDYYNYGGFPGSVFEAAARLNNVTYKRGTCCGTTSAAARFVSGESVSMVALMASLLSAYLML
ncbi:PLC-like phosphodiesterase [Thelonectria olida]|uniref:PLC-like phosphodiesterase n=1 Tax=Thelonectria olida TaxID=1576542 RepID=A0A9P8WJZ2_9HYPO|nr:PLC-like phosphodiesterase [Thelonectria olida]